MKPITLRHHVESTDRNIIEAITRSSGLFSDEEIDVALEVFDETTGTNKAGYQYIVAVSGKEIVGYACWGKDTQTQSSFELYWIAVDYSVRSRGIGSQLLKAVEASIRHVGGGKLFIETAGREQYRPTRMFYEGHDYVRVAWIDDYFGPGDAKVIYARQL